MSLSILGNSKNKNVYQVRCFTCLSVCLSVCVRFYVVSFFLALVYSGTQLEVLANDVLAKDGAFTDYTDTDGNWNVNKSNGNPIDLTVWTRYVECSFASLDCRGGAVLCVGNGVEGASDVVRRMCSHFMQ